MRSLTLDAYVIDVLLPDLVGHDRRPAAFLVYLYLLRHARTNNGRREVRASLQTIASSTGLSKSTVQNALRHLRRRALVDPNVIATTGNPTRSLLDPRAK
jgi:CRP-like cAMP-binding protein